MIDQKGVSCWAGSAAQHELAGRSKPGAGLRGLNCGQLWRFPDSSIHKCQRQLGRDYLVKILLHKESQRQVEKISKAGMEGTVLAPWAIALLIFGAVLIMTSLMILPPVTLLIWRIHQMPEISLVGAI
ncbi:uncharacterized protein LOC110201596 [Phascolarctos cinereus]